MDELVMIGRPYCDLRKSSTSCVMVASPKKYLRPRLASERRNDAVSSDFIIHHASSITKRRLRRFWRMAFQMKCMTIYIATGLSSSSISRIEKTINLLFMFTFEGWLMKPDHVPLVNLVSFSTSDSLPAIPESTSSKSDIRGASAFLKSESGVMSLRA